jgi:hypothetical protein
MLNGNIPTLDQIASDPARATHLPRQVALALISRCTAAQMALAASLSESDVRAPAPVATIDRTLDAHAIAKELGVTRRWVFRNAPNLPFVRRISRKSLVCSEADLRRWRSRQTA